jgi:pimeloyl-ACP methyl ester carboxylesterase
MAAPTMHFYLIPGMGANAQLYSKFQLPGVMHALDWPHHGDARTLADYAKILASQITTTHNILVGSSMGGMVATELSHLVRPMATILLSAPSGRHQFPMTLKTLDHLGLHKIVGPQQLYRLAHAADLFMGFKNPEDRKRFYDMLQTNGPEFLHFSVRAVLAWQHDSVPTGPYIHVLGSRDRLFKAHKIPHSAVVRGAGHFATHEKSEVICKLIDLYVAQSFDTKASIAMARAQWPEEFL